MHSALRPFTRRAAVGAAGVAVATALAAAPSAPTADASVTAASFSLTRVLTSGVHAVVRWAPCITTPSGPVTQVIHYKVNPAGHPGRVRTVRRAVHRLHLATGLHFHYSGRTHYVPQAAPVSGWLRGGDMLQHTGVPFVVAWAWRGSGAHHSNLLTTSEAGVGSIRWRTLGTQAGIATAAVVIQRGHIGVRPGFGAGATLGTLLEHELGHAVGLRHVGERSQVMYPVIGRWSPGSYGAGDRAGLRRVGAAAGCLSSALRVPRS